MSGFKNSCDFYSSILPYHKNLKLKCKSLTNAIQDEKQRREEERKIQFQNNMQNFLKEFIEKIREKLELLQLMAFDLGKEYVKSQCSIKLLENESLTHQKMLDKLNTKIDNLKRDSNLRIHETREEFLKNYKKLEEFKTKYEESEKDLNEICKERKSIEENLKCKKKELKEIFCKIKKHRETIPENVDVKEFSSLRNSYEELVIKLTKLNSIVKCTEDKVFKAHREGELIRKVLRSKLKIINEHDEWSREDLMRRKNKLEEKFKVESIEDSTIQQLSSEISVMEQKVKQSEEVIEELIAVVNKMIGFKRPCTKVAIENVLNQLKSEKKNPVIGTDYIGSTFVQLQ